MKKILFIGGVFGALALTSCKKDYICECQEIANDNKAINKYNLLKTSKRDAQTACDYKEVSFESNGDGFTANCKLL